MPDELTNRGEFTNVVEAKQTADACRLEHNHRRPNSSLGYQTLTEFVAGFAAAPSVWAAPSIRSSGMD
jgi:hypothetical protein